MDDTSEYSLKGGLGWEAAVTGTAPLYVRLWPSRNNTCPSKHRSSIIIHSSYYTQYLFLIYCAISGQIFIPNSV